MNEQEFMCNYLRYVCWLREYKWHDLGTVRNAVREWWREYSLFLDSDNAILLEHVEMARGNTKSRLTFRADPHTHAVSDQLYAYLLEQTHNALPDPCPFNFRDNAMISLADCARSLLQPYNRILWSVNENPMYRVVESTPVSLQDPDTWYTLSACTTLHPVPFLRPTMLLECIADMCRKRYANLTERYEKLTTFLTSSLDRENGVLVARPVYGVNVKPGSSLLQNYQVLVTNVVIDLERVSPPGILISEDANSQHLYAYLAPLPLSPYILYEQNVPTYKKTRLCLFVPRALVGQSVIGICAEFVRAFSPNNASKFFHLDAYLRHDNPSLCRVSPIPAVASEGILYAGVKGKKDAELLQVAMESNSRLYERRASLRDVLVPLKVRTLDEMWREYSCPSISITNSGLCVVRKTANEQLLVNGIPSRGVFSTQDNIEPMLLAPIPSQMKCKKIIDRVAYAINGLVVLFARDTLKRSLKLVGMKYDEMKWTYARGINDVRGALGKNARVVRRTWSFFVVEFDGWCRRIGYVPAYTSGERCYGDGFPSSLIAVVEWLDKCHRGGVEKDSRGRMPTLSNNDASTPTVSPRSSSNILAD